MRQPLNCSPSVEATEGFEYTKKIIKSIADKTAQDIRDKIKNNSTNLEESLVAICMLSYRLSL
jgi:hypothetical protein